MSLMSSALKILRLLQEFPTPKKDYDLRSSHFEFAREDGTTKKYQVVLEKFSPWSSIFGFGSRLRIPQLPHPQPPDRWWMGFDWTRGKCFGLRIELEPRPETTAQKVDPSTNILSFWVEGMVRTDPNRRIWYPKKILEFDDYADVGSADFDPSKLEYANQMLRVLVGPEFCRAASEALDFECIRFI